MGFFFSFFGEIVTGDEYVALSANALRGKYWMNKIKCTLSV